ncbi:MAG: sigma-70 family RNA polymerase sigma factor [Opitutaceae bacterium]|nr:sigma-70 family RNA polymerase sigma factor [Cytophagales bacterium]
MNQKEIIRCIQEGNDSKALSYLYDHTLIKVRGYIKKNNGTKDEANDIFQDAVIIFFKYVKNNQFDVEKDIDAFIYTVARNLWIDKAKKERRMVYYDNTEIYEQREDSSNQLSDLISQEKAIAMKSVFDRLDEKCRKILQYYVYEKRSMKEISLLMGYSSEDVVKTNHYRCKQYLTKIVKSDLSLMNLIRN